MEFKKLNADLQATGRRAVRKRQFHEFGALPRLHLQPPDDEFHRNTSLAGDQSRMQDLWLWHSVARRQRNAIGRTVSSPARWLAPRQALHRTRKLTPTVCLSDLPDSITAFRQEPITSRPTLHDPFFGRRRRGIESRAARRIYLVILARNR